MECPKDFEYDHFDGAQLHVINFKILRKPSVKLEWIGLNISNHSKSNINIFPEIYYIICGNYFLDVSYISHWNLAKSIYIKYPFEHVF